MADPQGLPPGAVLKPIQGASATVAAPQPTPAANSGLPPGATVKPIAQPAAQPAAGGNNGDGGFDWTDQAALVGDAFPVVGNAIGAIKSAGQTVTTASKLLHKIPVIGETLAPQSGIDKMDHATEIKNANEGVGATAETILEFMLGDEALKGLSLAEKLRHAAPIIKAFEKFPLLMKAVTTGLRQGTVGAAQSLAHGSTPTEALENGAIAGGTGGALELGAGGVSKILNKIKPGTTTIAGETMPKLASQEAEHAPLAEKVAPISSAPKVAEAQQAGTQQAVKNVARDAAENSVKRVNDTRVATTEEVPITKGGRTAINGSGESAASQEAINRVASEKAQGIKRVKIRPGGQEIPLIGPDAVDAKAGRGETIVKRYADGREEIQDQGAGARYTGPKTSIDQGIATRNEKAQIGSTAATVPESVMPTNKLTEEIGTTAGTIPKQVLEPKTVPEARNVTVDREVPAKFDKANVDPTKIHTFADAADHVENAAKPVYQKLDEVSGGKFTALREQRKAALQVLRDPASIDAWEKAQEKLTEAESGIDDLFKTHSDEVGRTDLKAANLAWKDAKTLDKIHTAVERSFNGVPENVANRTGVARKISGDALRRSMGNLLQKSGQEEIERVIGKAGVDNLYRIADLTSKPESLEATKDVAKNVAMYLSHRFGTGGVVGGAIGSLIGHTATGALAGAGLQDATMRVLHEAAVNPRVGKLIADAVKVGASPKVYSALITTALMQSDKENK